jgi:glycosyltransferase involved in cell wall biosynthesis
MKNPHINILMAAHDEGELIAYALNSVESQTYKTCSIICYGDDMTEATRDALEVFSARCSRKIELIDSSTNRGVAHARNTLVKASKDSNKEAYFLWLDADDRLNNAMALENVANRIRETNCDICIFDLEISESNKPVPLENLPVRLARDINRHRLLLRQMIKNHSGVSFFPKVNILNAATLGATRAFSGKLAENWINAAEGYIFEDFPQMALLLSSNKVAALDEKIINYCRRSNSLSSAAKISVQYSDRIRQLEVFLKNVDLTNIDVLAGVTDFIFWKRSQAESALLEMISAEPMKVSSSEAIGFRDAWNLFEAKFADPKTH